MPRKMKIADHEKWVDPIDLTNKPSMAKDWIDGFHHYYTFQARSTSGIADSLMFHLKTSAAQAWWLSVLKTVPREVLEASDDARLIELFLQRYAPDHLAEQYTETDKLVSGSVRHTKGNLDAYISAFMNEVRKCAGHADTYIAQHMQCQLFLNNLMPALNLIAWLTMLGMSGVCWKN